MMFIMRLWRKRVPEEPFLTAHPTTKELLLPPAELAGTAIAAIVMIVGVMSAFWHIQWIPYAVMLLTGHALGQWFCEYRMLQARKRWDEAFDKSLSTKLKCPMPRCVHCVDRSTPDALQEIVEHFQTKHGKYMQQIPRQDPSPGSRPSPRHLSH
jgi:hypothetical protein